MHRRFVSQLLVLCLATAALGDKGLTSRPLMPRSPAGEHQFTLLSPQQTGVHFAQPIDTSHPHKCLYVGGFASPGLAIGDLNGDGLPDLFVSGGPVDNRLYIQQAKDGLPTWKFNERAKTAGVGGAGNWSAGVTLVDIDGDGDLDIYVCNYDTPNQLFLNETAHPSQPKFVEQAKQWGLDLVDASFMSTFSDYDLDGDLDVYISAYQYVNPAGRPAKPPVRKIGSRYEVLPEYQKYYGIVRGANGQQTFTNVGRPDYLLQNRTRESGGKQRFVDVTQAAGIAGQGVGNSCLWWDYNQDGWPDIYVANDFKAPDQLFRNNGDGTFTDVIRGTFPHTTWFSMGSEAADVNNDGRVDLLVSDMAGTTHYRSKVTMGEMSVHTEFMKTARPPQLMRNALLINTGTPRFLEAAYLAGLAKSDWSWAVKLADFDNDGFQDAYITNGAARMFNHSDRNFTDAQRVGKTQWQLWEDTAPRKEENLAFRNRGDLKFEKCGKQWGLRRSSMSYAAAYGDMDLDGDLDLIVANLDEPLSLYRNNTQRGHSLLIRLTGPDGQRSAFGATVRLSNSSGSHVRRLSPSMGFQSCNQPLLHFGLGKHDIVPRLEVQWPGGATQTYYDLQVDKLYNLTHPKSDPTVTGRTAKQPAASRYFRPSRNFPALAHKETEYDDYARQPLLPYAHSQLGPGIAVADVDGDGDLDVYHGRAKGQRRAIYDNVGKGKLGLNTLLRGDERFEDMGCLLVDLDVDGAPDMYVVSGSVEGPEKSSNLRDRVYLNTGSGKFRLAPAAAQPKATDSGSVVCAADFDRDGDLDLFVGGRVIPGRYPATPVSHFYENRSQPGKLRLIEATATLAPGLKHTGLVTGAIWSDADDDGWLDLLVTHEWGPVKIYMNRANADGQRTLIERTAAAGLDAYRGWWNGIAASDLDGDGDIDYVVSNFGLNTQYKASDQKPELMYYGQFDDSGKHRILEAKYEQDRCFPRRGLSCSSHAMPFVRDKMKTFHNFGISTLEEIYTPKKLSDALQLSANTLETGILWNQGNAASQSGADRTPQFEFKPLPRMAQISPTFGVSIYDFDADGRVDIGLAQNFFAPQVETGRMDSGLSQILRAETDRHGKWQFVPMGPARSGISVAGDAKAICRMDINEDGWMDLLFTTNSGAVEAYEYLPSTLQASPLTVRLKGKPGNPTAIGAKVSVLLGEQYQSSEVHAGSGYLTQDSPTFQFARLQTDNTRVHVRWPDGTSTTHDVPPGQINVEIQW